MVLVIVAVATRIPPNLILTVTLRLFSVASGEPLCEQVEKLLGSDCKITDPVI